MRHTHLKHTQPDCSLHGRSIPGQFGGLSMYLGLIAVCGVADLALTLRALLTTGMLEANPFVVAVVRETGSAAALVAFKLLSLAFGVGVLYACRKRSSAVWAARLGA